MKLMVWTIDSPDQHLPVVAAIAAAARVDGATMTARSLSPTHDSLPTPGASGAGLGQFVPGEPASAGLITIRLAPKSAALSPVLGETIRAQIPGVRVASAREHVAMAPSLETTMSRIGLVARKESLSLGAFWQHWTQVHVPLVLAHDPLFDGYTTNLLDDRSLPWSGVVEQWFANPAAWAEHDRRLREERPVIVDDIGKFISHVVQFEAVQVATLRI